MSDVRLTLWHIVVSHYSEKVRWALDYKSVEHERRAPVPGMHMPVALWLTRGRAATLPIVEIDGVRIADSTAIIAALEQRSPDPPLYPDDPDERRRALDLEDWFDEELAPHIRRLAFTELHRDPQKFMELAGQTVPPWFQRLGRVTLAYGRVFTRLRYGAGRRDAVPRGHERVRAALDRLEAELGDNDYLVGDRFTIADLTAAALLYPLVLPAGMPVVIDRMPEPYERFRASLQSRRGYRWVEEMFRRHRRPKQVPAPVGLVT